MGFFVALLLRMTPRTTVSQGCWSRVEKNIWSTYDRTSNSVDTKKHHSEVNGLAQKEGGVDFVRIFIVQFTEKSMDLDVGRTIQLIS